MLEEFDEGEVVENKYNNVASANLKSKKSGIRTSTKDKKGKKKFNVTSSNNAPSKSLKKQAQKKRLIAVKPFLTPKHGEAKKKKRKRSRRSLDYDEDEIAEESENENFQDALTEDVAADDSIIGGDSPRVRRSPLNPSITEYIVDEMNEEHHRQQSLYPITSTDEDSIRNRRSLTFQPPPASIANFYFDQYNDIDTPDEDEADISDQQQEMVTDAEASNIARYDEDMSRQKRSVITTTKQSKDNVVAKAKRTLHEENLVKIFNANHNNVKARTKNVDTTKRSVVTSSASSPKGATITKVTDADQKKVAKALIQKAFFTTSKHVAMPKNVVRHIIPQSSSSKHTNPSVDVKILSKSLLNHDIGTIPGLKKETVVEKTVSRQHISHPVLENKQSPDSINTANVARAVAVAMEQLKRDKMWGKVFVHVRPTGELKVMVQETRKMEEN